MKYSKIAMTFLLILSLFSISPPSTADAMKPDFNAIAVGDHHFLAVDCNGEVWAWGRNTFGQLGFNHAGAPNENSENPMRVRMENGAILNNIVSVAAGSGHSVALDSNGRVWTWGLNSRGELGHHSFVNTTNPTRVPIQGTVVAIDAGPYHTMALDSTGQVWVWGDNAFGQAAGNLAPAPVQGLNNIIAISAGGEHSVALRNDGTVWAWGRGTFGQLGNNQTIHNNPAPQQVANINDVIAIAAGKYHTLVVRQDARVWGFGLNEYGQLGDMAHQQFNAPAQITNLTDVVSVKAGAFHSVALMRVGKAYMWGRNSHQPTAHRATPVLIENMVNGVEIATGGDAFQADGPFVLAVNEDGTLWQWNMKKVDPTTLRPVFSRVSGISCITVASAYPFIQGDQVVFRYEGRANAVEVRGQFNEDFVEIPLKEIRENVWEVLLKIPPGTYYYGFSVDGRWTNDRFNPERERLPSGTFNILTVPNYIPMSPIINHNKATFTYSSFDGRGLLERNANSKRVALQFSNGQQIEMKKGSNNIWSVSQELPVGTHYYNFIVQDSFSSFQQELLDPLNSLININPITGKKYNVLTIQDETMIQTPVQAVSIQGSNPINLSAGEELYLRVDVQPAAATNKQVRWFSSNEEVVTVDTHGMLTAHGPGTATITVTTVDGGHTNHKNVVVVGQPGLVQYPRPGYHDFGTRSDIDYDKDWEITFSEPVQEETVNGTNFYVLNSSGQRVRVAAFLDLNNPKIVRLERLSNFYYSPGGTYYSVIENGVRDRHGQSVERPAIMQFIIKW